jgi:hypothetical protein
LEEKEEEPPKGMMPAGYCLLVPAWIWDDAVDGWMDESIDRLVD